MSVLTDTLINALAALIRTNGETPASDVRAFETLMIGAIGTLEARARGNTIHVTAGVPADALGVDGDVAMDETTGDVYQFTDGAFELAFNIMGKPGAQGPKPVLGVDYTIPEPLRGLRGPQGPKPVLGVDYTVTNGADGDDGSRIFDKAFAPTPADDANGKEGEQWYHSKTAAAYDRYAHLNGTWRLVFSSGTGVAVTPPAANQFPAIQFNAPASGASVPVGTALTLTATATDDVAVTGVEFLNGTTGASLGMGSKNGSTYTLPFTPTTAGPFSFVAKATDGAGLSNTATVSITVQAAANPEAPFWNYDPVTRVLTATHALGTSELETSRQGGAYAPYAPINVDDNAHQASEWKTRVKAYAAGNRNVGGTADSPAIAAKAAPVNQMPVANAGSDTSLTLPTNSVVLQGSGSDAEGPVTYAWTQLVGPNTATGLPSAAAMPVVSNLVAGTYQFRLTVTDSANVTKTDDVVVTVNAAAPTTSRPWRITPFGNSITAANVWYTVAKELLGTAVTYGPNLGVSGQDFNDLIARLNAGTLPAADPAYEDWVLLQEFTNTRNSSEWDTPYSTNLCAQTVSILRGRGYKVAVWVPTPRVLSRPTTEPFNFVKSTLRNNPAGWDMLLDIAVHTAADQGEDALSAVFYDDLGVHPTDRLYTIMGHLVAEAFAPGSTRSGIKTTQFDNTPASPPPPPPPAPSLAGEPVVWTNFTGSPTTTADGSITATANGDSANSTRGFGPTTEAVRGWMEFEVQPPVTEQVQLVVGPSDHAAAGGGYGDSQYSIHYFNADVRTFGIQTGPWQPSLPPGAKVRVTLYNSPVRKVVWSINGTTWEEALVSSYSDNVIGIDLGFLAKDTLHKCRIGGPNLLPL